MSRGRIKVAAIAAIAIAIAAILYVRCRSHDVGNAGEREHVPADRASVAAAGTPARNASRRLTIVVTADGRPAAGAFVVVQRDGDPPVLGRTGNDGHFATVARATEYSVRTWSAGFGLEYASVDLRDRDVELALALRACARDLTGTVSDDNGGPIEGASVDDGWALSDKNGRFEICDDNGQRTLVVAAAGYASESRFLMPFDRDVSFVLHPEAVLAGHVVGPDHAAVAGAQVNVWIRDGTPSAARAAGGTGTSDASGHFEIHGLGVGTYSVRPQAKGFGARGPLDVGLHVGANAEIEIALAASQRIRGIARSAGRPVAHAEIHWWPQPAWATPALGTTGEDGRFELDDAAHTRGTFVVIGYRPVRDRDVDDAPVELELVPELYIRGHVVHDGKPVIGATVDGVGFPGRTDDTGAFALQVPVGGPYKLQAHSEQLGGFAREVAVTVTDRSIDGVVLDIAFTASISGTVKDEDGRAMIGAHVQLSNDAVKDVGDGTVRRDGTFRAAKLSGGEGAYEVKVMLAGVEVPQRGGRRASVAVPRPDSAIDGVAITVVNHTATIAGRVEHRDGGPVADAAIEARAPGRWGEAVAITRTSLDGKFSLSVPVNHSYEVLVTGEPGQRVRLTGIAPGGPELRVVLAPPGRVHVWCREGTRSVTLFSGVTHLSDVACGSTVPLVPVGRAVAIGQPTGLGEVVVVSDQTAELAIGELPRRDVRVTAKRDGAPVAGALCVGSYSETNAVAADPTGGSGRTDASGTVTIGLAKIPARLFCYSDDWAATGEIGPNQDRVVIEGP